jgi:arabinogalactan oligomer / maltooligosaccharide transport system substrate-binding protein
MMQRAYLGIETAFVSALLAFLPTFLLALLLALTGCKDQGSAGPSASSSSAVASASASAGAKGTKLTCAHPLVIWPSLSTDETQFLKNQAKAFEKATSVKATFLDVPLGELQKKFIQSVPGGQGPDILIGPSDWAGVLSEGGFVVDLTGKVDVSKFIDATVKAATYKGKLFGVPESFEVVTQFYNTAIAPVGNVSFDEMTALRPNVPEGSYVLAYDIGDFYHSVAFLHAVGGRVFDAAGNFAITEGAATKWLTTLKEFKEKASMPKEVTGEAAKALFLSGKISSYFSGPWDVSDIMKSNVKWKITKLPKIEGSSALPFLSVKVFYLSSKSDCIDAALAFAEMFVGAESEAKLVKTVNPAHVPASKAAHDDPALITSLAIQGFRAQAAFSVPFPNNPDMGQVFPPANEAISAVLNQGVDPAVAAKKMIETIKASIQKQK